jgi:isoleucyl-tRNA synthetase
VREKASSGSDEERRMVLYTIYRVLKRALVLLAPITPMLAEKIYLNLAQRFDDDNSHTDTTATGTTHAVQSSVHLADWPACQE